MKHFEPSPYSYGSFGGAYGADWRFVNIFSKEGRAENKMARAEKAREKAKDKGGKASDRLKRRADRLEMRSANIKKDVRGGKTIAPSFKNRKKLWAVEYPFTARAERKGWLNRTEVMRHTAKGHQPAYQLINQELRATIVGGLEILQLAYNPDTGGPGYPPFDTIDTNMMRVSAKGAKEDKYMIRQVAAAAKALKEKPPKTLRQAAKFVRQQVIKHGLEGPAWANRALYLVTSAMERADTVSKVGSIVAGTAATALGIAATVVTAGAATPLAVAAAGATVAAATSSAVGAAKAAKLGGEWDVYQLEVETALKERENKYVTEQLEREASITEALQDAILKAEEERQAKIGQFLGKCLYTSLGIVFVGFAYKQLKRKK